MTYLIKILISLRLAEMQIISYNFIILKHIQINSQFQKILILKVLSFWGDS